MIYSDPSSPGADGDSASLSLSPSLSIYLSVSPPSVSIYIHPSTSPVSLALSSSSTESFYPFFSIRLSLSTSSFFSVDPVPLSLPNGETVSSRYSWGGRIARGLVTRLRTHLLLARQLGPSVHQATILLISARIGLVAKCSQDYQFTMARGELRDTASIENNAECRLRPWWCSVISNVQYHYW